MLHYIVYYYMLCFLWSLYCSFSGKGSKSIESINSQNSFLCLDISSCLISIQFLSWLIWCFRTSCCVLVFSHWNRRCIYVCMFVRMSVWMYVCMRIYMFMYVCIYINIHIIYVYVRMYVWTCVCLCMYICICVRMYICLYMYVLVCMYICLHTKVLIYVFMHTYI